MTYFKSPAGIDLPKGEKIVRNDLQRNVLPPHDTVFSTEGSEGGESGGSIRTPRQRSTIDGSKCHPIASISEGYQLAGETGD